MHIPYVERLWPDARQEAVSDVAPRAVAQVVLGEAGQRPLAAHERWQTALELLIDGIACKQAYHIYNRA